MLQNTFIYEENNFVSIRKYLQFKNVITLFARSVDPFPSSIYSSTTFDFAFAIFKYIEKNRLTRRYFLWTKDPGDPKPNPQHGIFTYFGRKKKPNLATTSQNDRNKFPIFRNQNQLLLL